MEEYRASRYPPYTVEVKIEVEVEVGSSDSVSGLGY